MFSIGYKSFTIFGFIRFFKSLGAIQQICPMPLQPHSLQHSCIVNPLLESFLPMQHRRLIVVNRSEVIRFVSQLVPHRFEVVGDAVFVVDVLYSHRFLDYFPRPLPDACVFSDSKFVHLDHVFDCPLPRNMFYILYFT